MSGPRQRSSFQASFDAAMAIAWGLLAAFGLVGALVRDDHGFIVCVIACVGWTIVRIIVEAIKAIGQVTGRNARR